MMFCAVGPLIDDKIEEKLSFTAIPAALPPFEGIFTGKLIGMICTGEESIICAILSEATYQSIGGLVL
jgi:hypothetical protein